MKFNCCNDCCYCRTDENSLIDVCTLGKKCDRIICVCCAKLISIEQYKETNGFCDDCENMFGDD